MGKGRGSTLARECWEEVRDRAEREKEVSKWEEEKVRYFEERGVEIGEVERRRREGEMDYGQVMRKDMDMDRKERWEKIREAKYNKWYGWVKGNGDTRIFEKGLGRGKVAEGG